MRFTYHAEPAIGRASMDVDSLIAELRGANVRKKASRAGVRLNRPRRTRLDRGMPQLNFPDPYFIYFLRWRSWA